MCGNRGHKQCFVKRNRTPVGTSSVEPSAAAPNALPFSANLRLFKFFNKVLTPLSDSSVCQPYGNIWVATNDNTSKLKSQLLFIVSFHSAYSSLIVLSIPPSSPLAKLLSAPKRKSTSVYGRNNVYIHTFTVMTVKQKRAFAKRVYRPTD